jgi:hypothetical protein
VLRPSLFCKILKIKDYVDAAVMTQGKLTAIFLFAAMPAALLFPNLSVYCQASKPPLEAFQATGAWYNRDSSTVQPLQLSFRKNLNLTQSGTIHLRELYPNGYNIPISIQVPDNARSYFNQSRRKNSINEIQYTYNQTPYPIQLPENKSRLWIVAGSHAAIWTGTFIALNHAWYRDYPKAPFHLFDDRLEWHQMDKAGHVWTSYQLSRHSAASWKWAGMTDRQSAWFGGASAFAFQSIIEILDGFSEEWGFSIGDMEANLIGAGGYVVQQLLLKEQIFQVKFGYSAYDYPDDLKPRRDELFGTSLPEQLLKDYNSQRYWLSANLKSLSRSSKMPAWLNFAFGYSADGLYGAESNVWTDDQGNYFDRTDIRRVRRFYLSPDIDLTKIKTKSKFLRSVFFVVNMIKVPAPAIEYNTNGKLKFHPLLF